MIYQDILISLFVSIFRRDNLQFLEIYNEAFKTYISSKTAR